MASARNATASTTSAAATAAAAAAAVIEGTAKARSRRNSSTAASSRRKAAALQGLHSDGTRQRAMSIGPPEMSRRDAPPAELQSVEAGLVRTAEAVVAGRKSSSSCVHSDSVLESHVLPVLPTTSSAACSSNNSTGSNHNVVGIAGISSTQAHKPIAAAENTIELRRHEGGAGAYEHSYHGEVIIRTQILFVLVHDVALLFSPYWMSQKLVFICSMSQHSQVLTYRCTIVAFSRSQRGAASSEHHRR
jgi:hypothetical protein